MTDKLIDDEPIVVEEKPRKRGRPKKNPDAAPQPKTDKPRRGRKKVSATDTATKPQKKSVDKVREFGIQKNHPKGWFWLSLGMVLAEIRRRNETVPPDNLWG